MKRTALVLQAIALLTVLTSPAWAEGLQKVEYFADSIIEKEESYIRLLGGSSWRLSAPSLALVTDDVIIVFRTIELRDRQQVTGPIAYVGGGEIPIRHVGGSYATQPGYLTTVIEAVGKGAVLKLTDGTVLSVPEYDRFDTEWWLPPYKALLTASKLYLYNLKNGRRVWVSPFR